MFSFPGHGRRCLELAAHQIFPRGKDCGARQREPPGSGKELKRRFGIGLVPAAEVKQMGDEWEDLFVQAKASQVQKLKSWQQRLEEAAYLAVDLCSPRRILV